MTFVKARPCLQKKVSDHIHKKIYKDLFDALPLDSWPRPLFHSCQGPGAAGWLTAVPVEPRKTMNNFIYRMAVALRLGLTIPQTFLAKKCICDKDVDRLGYHYLLCNHGNQRHFRHDALRDVFQKVLHEAGIKANTEVYLQSIGVTPPDDDPNSQRIDLYFVLDGQGHLGDVSITHPNRPNSDTPHWLYVNRHNGEEAGRAAKHTEALKEEKYGANARQAGHKLVGLIAETFGRWGPETHKLIRRLAARKRPPAGASLEEATEYREGVVNHWYQILSVALMKHSVFQMVSRAQTAADRESKEFAARFGEDFVSRGPYRPHVGGGGVPFE